MTSISVVNAVEGGEKDQQDGITSSRLSNVAKTAAKNPVWPMKSSHQNYEIASKEYKESPLEKYVAAGLGDELPKMRDELIKRKQSGEGFVERHAKAWANPENWKVDPNNEVNEISNPILSEK